MSSCRRSPHRLVEPADEALKEPSDAPSTRKTAFSVAVLWRRNRPLPTTIRIGSPHRGETTAPCRRNSDRRGRRKDPNRRSVWKLKFNLKPVIGYLLGDMIDRIKKCLDSRRPHLYPGVLDACCLRHRCISLSMNTRGTSRCCRLHNSLQVQFLFTHESGSSLSISSPAPTSFTRRRIARHSPVFSR
jgi:hypothetical protein